MLTVKLGECTDCLDLSATICDIDDKLFWYGKNLLNNTKLLTCLDFNKQNIDLLVTYKRILISKIFNPTYACDINLANILSRIKVLLNK